MIPFKKSARPGPVPPRVIEDTYALLRTPVKAGAVMKFEDAWTDSPTVFRYGGRFYMYFISISKDVGVSGYDTHIACSDDLLRWTYLGPILRRNGIDRWDGRQCAGYAAYTDIDFNASCGSQTVNGFYYMSYLAGNSDGYEPDPLFMGLARSADPTDPGAFVRLPEPILRPGDPDARPFEDKTLYKSFLFRDDAMTTGFPFVAVYNAKGWDERERIFLAVSADGERFERYGNAAVLDCSSEGARITGDPQILKIDDLYVMPYFRLDAAGGAYDTFVCSYDLVNWTKWTGAPLIAPAEPWENAHAHKPWLIRHNGTTFHFYCAVNDKNERFIAVAHS